MDNKFMAKALEEAYTGIEDGDGGPFGAVITKNGKIIGQGHNCVVSKKDPTLHGEMMAIKDACKNIDSFDLKGCEIYTTAEPCPMCLGAILWAGIEKIYYGCDRYDSEKIGFRDSAFYDVLAKGKEGFEIKEIDREECLKLFEKYKGMSDKQMY